MPYAEAVGTAERFGQGQGSEATRILYCRWDRWPDLAQALLADVTTTTRLNTIGAPIPIIRRLLPEPHPRYRWMYCVEASLAEGVGVPGIDDNKLFAYLNGLVNAAADDQTGWAKVIARYTPLPYNATLTDAQVDAAVGYTGGRDPGIGDGELLRFTERKGTYQAEATEIGGAAFRWCPPGNNNVIGQQAPVKVLPTAELTYTLYMWPRDFVPSAALGVGTTVGGQQKPVLGRINNAPFDAGSLLRTPIPVCCGLYLGAEFGDLYYTPTGVACYDISYKISYRPQGWNFIFRKSEHDFREVTIDGAPRQQLEPNALDHERPYDSFLMTNLWRPI